MFRAQQTPEEAWDDAAAFEQDFVDSLLLAEDQMRRASEWILDSSTTVVEAREIAEMASAKAHGEIRYLRHLLYQRETGLAYAALGWTEPLLLWLQPGLHGKKSEHAKAVEYLHEVVELIDSGSAVLVQVSGFADVYLMHNSDGHIAFQNALVFQQCTGHAEKFLKDVGKWR